MLSSSGRPSVVVDYAHTPDALDNALRALASHAGRLWCVFGCGGERDTGKRAEMARVAETHADSVIVTDDNPVVSPLMVFAKRFWRALATRLSHLK